MAVALVLLGGLTLFVLENQRQLKDAAAKLDQYQVMQGPKGQLIRLHKATGTTSVLADGMDTALLRPLHYDWSLSDGSHVDANLAWINGGQNGEVHFTIIVKNPPQQLQDRVLKRRALGDQVYGILLETQEGVRVCRVPVYANEFHWNRDADGSISLEAGGAEPCSASRYASVRRANILSY
jgi:hypothetical protein